MGRRTARSERGEQRAPLERWVLAYEHRALVPPDQAVSRRHVEQLEVFEAKPSPEQFGGGFVF